MKPMPEELKQKVPLHHIFIFLITINIINFPYYSAISVFLNENIYILSLLVLSRPGTYCAYGRLWPPIAAYGLSEPPIDDYIDG